VDQEVREGVNESQGRLQGRHVAIRAADGIEDDVTSKDRRAEDAAQGCGEVFLEKDQVRQQRAGELRGRHAVIVEDPLLGHGDLSQRGLGSEELLEPILVAGRLRRDELQRIGGDSHLVLQRAAVEGLYARCLALVTEAADGVVLRRDPIDTSGDPVPVCIGGILP
jgi:hypothetical protein